jgi:hypothetical protein
MIGDGKGMGAIPANPERINQIARTIIPMFRLKLTAISHLQWQTLQETRGRHNT